MGQETPKTYDKLVSKISQQHSHNAEGITKNISTMFPEDGPQSQGFHQATLMCVLYMHIKRF